MFLQKFHRIREAHKGKQKRGEGGGEHNQKALNTCTKLSENKGNKIIIKSSKIIRAEHNPHSKGSISCNIGTTVPR